MATIEDAINTYLLTQSTITAYVGNDIYHCAIQENLETDYIRYQMIIASNDPVEFADKTTAQPTFQFDIFSKNDSSALAIGNALVTALHGFSGSLATGINVVTSMARGPLIMRDGTDEQWYHGIVEWNPEYAR